MDGDCGGARPSSAPVGTGRCKCTSQRPDELPQAIAILENLVLETRYAGKSANPHQDRRSVAPVGAPNEEGSILEIFSRIAGKVPEVAWKQLPAGLSKNVHHYIYGTERDDE